MEPLNVGLQLAVYGMVLVFLLLAVMAGLIALLLRLDRAAATPGPEEPGRPEARPAEKPAELDADALAAIVIAVRTHQAAMRKQAAPAMRRYQPGTLPSRWVGIGRTRQNTSWQPRRRS